MRRAPEATEAVIFPAKLARTLLAYLYLGPVLLSALGCLFFFENSEGVLDDRLPALAGLPLMLMQLGIALLFPFCKAGAAYLIRPIQRPTPHVTPNYVRSQVAAAEPRAKDSQTWTSRCCRRDSTLMMTSPSPLLTDAFCSSRSKLQEAAQLHFQELEARQWN